jgi:hypothetical protein
VSLEILAVMELMDCRVHKVVQATKAKRAPEVIKVK